MTNTEPENTSAARAAVRIIECWEEEYTPECAALKSEIMKIIEQETAAECAAWEQEKVELLERIDALEKVLRGSLDIQDYIDEIRAALTPPTGVQNVQS